MPSWRRWPTDLWGDSDGTTKTEHRFGLGRVSWGRAARDVLAADGLRPDFEFTGTRPDAVVDYIHQTDPRAEIFFLCNRKDRPEEVRGTFRVGGRQPELWDPATGEARAAGAFRQVDGRTTLPLEFAPYGSLFVLFRKTIAADAAGDAGATPRPTPGRTELGGPWAVTFDPERGGPGSVDLPRLVSWTARPEDGIKYYSGTASYRKAFDLPASLRMPHRRLALDLGEVRGIAEARLNGKPLGVLWSPPFARRSRTPSGRWTTSSRSMSSTPGTIASPGMRGCRRGDGPCGRTSGWTPFLGPRIPVCSAP